MSRDLETVANEFCARFEESAATLGVLAQGVGELVETFSTVDFGAANWERRRAAKSAKALKAALEQFIQDQARLSAKVRKIACKTQFPA